MLWTSILLAIGLLRLGTFIKYIPYPVTVGFTSGIAAIIFVSQVKELLGLTLSGAEPGPFVPKLRALAEALPRHGARVYIAGALPAVRRALLTHGVRPPRVRYRTKLAEALAAAHGPPEDPAATGSSFDQIEPLPAAIKGNR